MADDQPRLYEGMFLFNPAAIQSSVATAAGTVKELLDRAGAEIEAVYKWDDRRLAYPINGQKRGLYMLAYFRVRGVQIANIERDVNLSEQIMRCLIIRADHFGETELELARDKQKDTLAAAGLEGGSLPSGEDAQTQTAEPAGATDQPAQAQPAEQTAEQPAQQATESPGA